MIVFKYFCENLPTFWQADNRRVFPFFDDDMYGTVAVESQHPCDITSALILAVSVCYHSRLQHREDYERVVSSRFVPPLALPGGAAQFINKITWSV